MDSSDYFTLFLAVASVVFGVMSIVKKKTSYQYGEGGEGDEATGAHALMLGWFWILMGGFLIVAYILDYYQLIEIGGFKNILKFFVSGDEAALDKAFE